MEWEDEYEEEVVVEEERKVAAEWWFAWMGKDDLIEQVMWRAIFLDLKSTANPQQYKFPHSLCPFSFWMNWTLQSVFEYVMKMFEKMFLLH